MDLSIDRASLAREHLRGFARRILPLFNDISLGCILAPANSGAVMYGIAKEICRRRGIALPPLALAPVFTAYRFGDVLEPPYDNQLAFRALKPQLADFPSQIKKICYVDDEIGHGTAFRASWEALRMAAPANMLVDCAVLIVAEANGFFSDYPLAEARTLFAPYATRPSPDASGIIYDIFPETMFNDFRERFGVEDKKEILATIFGAPVKALDGRKPVLSHQLLQKAQSDPRYPLWREESATAINTALGALLDNDPLPDTIKRF